MNQFTILAAFAIIALSGFSMAHTLEKRSLWGGAPVETPEVQHAKALHFAAHAAARSGHPLPQEVYHGYHVPVIHNGVPVDTPEVQHAKAAHYAAVAKAAAESHSHHGSWDDGSDHYAHAHHAHHGPAPHHGPIHIPVIHNGVPTETPEVQHAKAAHYAAVHEAQARSGGGYEHGYDHGQDDGSYHHGHHAQW